MTETKTNFQTLNELITNHIMTILNEEMSGVEQDSSICYRRTLGSI